jgi:signal transduction histidine kinase
MKKKIIIGLSIFSLVFIASAIYTVVTIEQATMEMDRLVRLHQVEILREHLLIQIKRAQSDLYLKNTPYARSIDTIVTHVRTMSGIITTCFDCHHDEQVTSRLRGLKNQVDDYKNALSRVLTLRANAARLRTEEDRAFRVGMDLIAEVENITTMANSKLENRTKAAFQDISRTKTMLYLLAMAVPLAAVVLSIVFIRGFTRPVQELLTATRKLKNGDLSYRIGHLQDEFGEVAASFNDMAHSLRENCLRMQWAEQLVVLAEMAGGLAHEIKNPLAGIKASMEVLAGDPSLTAVNRDLLRMGVEQTKRIEQLLKSMLNFARPPKPMFTSVDVNDVIASTISLAERHPLYASRNGHSITVVRELASGLRPVKADPLQLQQVFMNLLLNAAEAMPAGGTVTVRTADTGPGEPIQIRIIDTGSGIDEAVVAKIFQPFFTTKPHGTGLGLAITKKLIEQHNGTIRVENNHDSGVSFFITLPAMVKEEVLALEGPGQNISDR